MTAQGTKLRSGVARRPSRRAVLAATLGNVLEFYDFTVYGFFAVAIGGTFFPTGDATASLLLSVATFGVGFLTRPLGAVVIGALADRAGRRPAMLLSLGLMAIGMALLTLTPSYAAIGLWAPGPVVLARLLQGFAVGGDVGAASAYLIEAAAEHRRGLLGSLQIAGQGISTLLAGLVGAGLSLTLSGPEIESWGWRLAMAAGLLIIPAGLWMRAAMPETLPPSPREAHDGRAGTILAVFREHPRAVALALLATMAGTVAIYTLNYMTTYAEATLHLPVQVGLLAPLVNGACGAVGALAGGWLSDRFGRKPVMILPRLLLALLAYPGFILLNAAPGATTLLIVTGVLTLLTAPSTAVAAVLIPESFPPALRAAGFAITYALAVTLFGGSAQVVVTWLIAATGDPLAPAGYLVATSIVGVVAMAMMTETHPRPGLAHAVPSAKIKN